MQARVVRKGIGNGKCRTDECGFVADRPDAAPECSLAPVLVANPAKQHTFKALQWGLRYAVEVLGDVQHWIVGHGEASFVFIRNVKPA